MKRILLSLTLVLSILTIAWANQQPKTQQWEYKLEFKISEKKANELAAQGWELVGAGSENAGPVSVSFLMFKRPK